MRLIAGQYVLIDGMTSLESAGHILEAESAFVEQDDEVIDEVGSFVDDLLLRVSYGGKRELHTFLADLLGDAFAAGGGKPGRITLVATFLQALPDNRFELGDKSDVRGDHVRFLRFS